MRSRLAVILVWLWSSHAMAAGVDPAALRACLLQNSGPAQEESMRRAMVALMADDVTTTKGDIVQFSVMAAGLVTAKCGLKPDLVREAAVRQAFKDYGAMLGGKVVSDALKRAAAAK